MAFIDLPDIDKVDEETKKKFEASKAIMGQIGETSRILAIRPDIYDVTTQMVRTLLLPKTELDHETKELIAMVVSLENGCTMCVGEHERIAKLLGVAEERILEVKEGIDSLKVPEAKKQLLHFCKKAAMDAHKIIREDLDALREAGYTDTQILEAVAIVGYFNYINTVVCAMGAGKD